ncbi:hypothetical protein AGMMS50230_22460 [Spirochaetia bacterium]|nr:hypothetical protein AGMMS50230_22460 [Spirochaetia bacterium]
MRFIWDEKKNLLNIKKHKISFAQAAQAFFDPFKKEYYDDKHSTLNEDRLMLVGFAKNSILLISFTQPEPETVRIISARRANKYEEEKYYYGNG